MEMIRLRNGTQEGAVLVQSLFDKVAQLRGDNPTAFREFVMACRDSGELSLGSAYVLKRLKLVLVSGEIDRSTKNVVTCITAVVGGNIQLRSPIDWE